MPQNHSRGCQISKIFCQGSMPPDPLTILSTLATYHKSLKILLLLVVGCHIMLIHLLLISTCSACIYVIIDQLCTIKNIEQYCIDSKNCHMYIHTHIHTACLGLLLLVPPALNELLGAYSELH